MKRSFLLSLSLLALCAFAREASEGEIRRRNRGRREAAELETKRDELKERIRQSLEAAETLNVTAELMEGARKFPPVERERLSEVRVFEPGLARAVDKTAEAKSTCVHRWMTLDEGRRYRFVADVKAADVKGADIKFGLMVPRRVGGTLWPSASVGQGTFDWRQVSFDFTMPAGAASTLLLYGLEGGSGHVEFRDVTVYEITRTLEGSAPVSENWW